MGIMNIIIHNPLIRSDTAATATMDRPQQRIPPSFRRPKNAILANDASQPSSSVVTNNKSGGDAAAADDEINDIHHHSRAKQQQQQQVHLDEGNVAHCARWLASSSSSSGKNQDDGDHSNSIRTVSLNIANLTVSMEGMDAILHFLQTSPTLMDVRLSNSNSRNNCNCSTQPPPPPLQHHQKPTSTATTSLQQQQILMERLLQAMVGNLSIQRVAFKNVPLPAPLLAQLFRGCLPQQKRDSESTTRDRILTHLSISGCTLMVNRNGDRPDGNKHHTTTGNAATDAAASNAAIRTAAAALGGAASATLQYVSLVAIDEPWLVRMLHALRRSPALRRLDVSVAGPRGAAAVAGLLLSQQQQQQRSSSSHHGTVLPGLDHLVLRDSSLRYLEPIVRSLMHRQDSKNGSASATTTTTSTIRTLELVHCTADAISAALLRSLILHCDDTLQSYSFCDVDFEEPESVREILGALTGARVRRLKWHRVHHRGMQPSAPEAMAPLLALLQSNPHLRRAELDRTVLLSLSNRAATAATAAMASASTTSNSNSSSSSTGLDGSNPKKQNQQNAAATLQSGMLALSRVGVYNATKNVASNTL